MEDMSLDYIVEGRKTDNSNYYVFDNKLQQYFQDTIKKRYEIEEFK